MDMVKYRFGSASPTLRRAWLPSRRGRAHHGTSAESWTYCKSPGWLRSKTCRDAVFAKPGRTLLVWKNVQTKFPWGVLLLMGGGFALAKGANESCLSQVLSIKLAGLKSLDPSMVLFIVCIISSVLSQVASNSTIVTIMVPVVFVLSETLGTNPLYLALGVTITASYAFMLPVGTPYNAIVYDAGKKGADLKVLHMSGVGLILGALFLLTTLLSLHTWTGAILGLDTIPAWANTTLNTKSSECAVKLAQILNNTIEP